MSVGESDSDAITVTAPTVFIQITSWEPASAAQAARKPGRRSGASADSSAGAACSVGRAVSVTGSEGAANACIMLVDGVFEPTGERGSDSARRGARGRRPPRHGIPSAERGDPPARERGDREARPQGGREARLPTEPDRARAEDESLVH